MVVDASYKLMDLPQAAREKRVKLVKQHLSNGKCILTYLIHGVTVLKSYHIMSSVALR